MDLYIYYRVRSEDTQRLREQVGALQQCLSQEYGIVISLKRRPEEKDGRQTWMEIYHAVPAGFDAILADAVAHAGLATLIDGQRHTEYFLDLSSCA